MTESIITISADIEKALTKYSDDISDGIKNLSDECADELKEELKKTSPRKRGKYAKAWKVKNLSNGRLNYANVVYNPRGQLTHLLENGHALRRGGRSIGIVKAYPHISPAENKIKKKYENGIKEIITKG